MRNRSRFGGVNGAAEVDSRLLIDPLLTKGA